MVLAHLSDRIARRAGVALGALLLCTRVPAVAQTSISIYSDGHVVVRRTVARALNKGRNVVSIDPGSSSVDPGLVFSLDSDVTIATVIDRPATSRADALERAIGSTLDFVRAKGDTVRATVVRDDPPQYRLPDNRFLLVTPGEPLFPKELINSAPTLVITLDAARAKPGANLAWVTGGVKWSASYQVLLEPGGRASVTGTATVESQGFSAESASVQLVAGAITRTQPPLRPMAMRVAGAAALGPVEVGESRVGDVHVYTLPDPLTIEAGMPVSVALFSSARTTTVREYVLPGLLPFGGYPVALPTEGSGRVPVQVWYTLKHAQGTNFGDRPLPAGTLQAFERDAMDHVQLIGEAATQHTAAGTDLRVQTGEAFDVTALKVQTDFSEQPLGTAQRGQPARRRVTASYRVTLNNAKPDPVTVDVREVHGGQWIVVTSSIPSEKLSSFEVRFRVPVPARGEATLTYTVQVDS